MCEIRRRQFFPAVLIALMMQAVVCASQQLTIQTEAGKQTRLARADIEALPHAKVTTGASGVSTTFDGVPLKAVLERGGVGFGETLKGKRLASCLLVEAADGYRVCDCAARDRRGVR